MSAWVRGHSTSCQETTLSSSKEYVAHGVAAEVLTGDSGVAGRLSFSLGSFLQNGGPRAVVPPSLCTSSTTLPGLRDPFLPLWLQADLIALSSSHPRLRPPAIGLSSTQAQLALLVFILCFKQPLIHGSVKQTSSICGPRKGLYQIAR